MDNPYTTYLLILVFVLAIIVNAYLLWSKLFDHNDELRFRDIIFGLPFIILLIVSAHLFNP